MSRRTAKPNTKIIKERSAEGNKRRLLGPQDDSQSIAAIHAALDQGINWVDTAAIYGFGHSCVITLWVICSARLSSAARSSGGW